MAEDDKELKDQRVVTMMSPSELEAIDDWMFKNRIRSRGEAIRRLCQVGIMSERRFEDFSNKLNANRDEYRNLATQLASAEAGTPQYRATDLDMRIKNNNGLILAFQFLSGFAVSMATIMASASLGDAIKYLEAFEDHLSAAGGDDFDLLVRAAGGDAEAANQLSQAIRARADK